MVRELDVLSSWNMGTESLLQSGFPSQQYVHVLRVHKCSQWPCAAKSCRKGKGSQSNSGCIPRSFPISVTVFPICLTFSHLKTNNLILQKQLMEIWQKLNCILVRRDYLSNGFLQILQIFSTQLFPKLIKRINGLLWSEKGIKTQDELSYLVKVLCISFQQCNIKMLDIWQRCGILQPLPLIPL